MPRLAFRMWLPSSHRHHFPRAGGTTAGDEVIGRTKKTCSPCAARVLGPKPTLTRVANCLEWPKLSDSSWLNPTQECGFYEFATSVNTHVISRKVAPCSCDQHPCQIGSPISCGCKPASITASATFGHSTSRTCKI